MKEEKMKNQAKKWAEMFMKSPMDFMADYKTTVDIGRYEDNALFIIVKLAEVYENYLREEKTREETVKSQNHLLEVYRICTTKQMSVADVLCRDIHV